MRKTDQWYRPLLRRVLRHPALDGWLIAIQFLRAEFIPSLDEGSIHVFFYVIYFQMHMALFIESELEFFESRN
jgi:Cu/Ag efflux pump CusA